MAKVSTMSCLHTVFLLIQKSFVHDGYWVSKMCLTTFQQKISVSKKFQMYSTSHRQCQNMDTWSKWNVFKPICCSAKTCLCSPCACPSNCLGNSQALKACAGFLLEAKLLLTNQPTNQSTVSTVLQSSLHRSAVDLYFFGKQYKVCLLTNISSSSSLAWISRMEKPLVYRTSFKCKIL